MSQVGNSNDQVRSEVSMADAKIERIQAMKLVELREQLKRRKLRTSGSKKELQDRLKAIIMLEIEHGRESEDEGRSGGSDDESDLELDEDVCDRMHLLTFRDVEESMNTFSGDDRINIRCWLEEFEDMAKLCKWSDMQKVIYVKRLLRGSAKLFVNYEKCCKSWPVLEKALKQEFSQSVDAHKVHQELSRRSKKPDETFQQYIYSMLEIAKQADMGTSSVIKYIIDGIQDEEVNKTILYGARDVRELKDKFALYEAMKENMKRKQKRVEEKPKRMVREDVSKEAARRCFLCGNRNHISSSCPTKRQGIKCFKCQQYGHVASKCRVVDNAPKDTCSTSQPSQGKRCKEVQIAECELVALIDTGSDLSLMRADHFVKIGAPKLDKTVVRFRGVGSENNYTLGQFYTNIAIDGVSFPIKIHIVSDTLMQHGLIIGTDFLNKVEVNMKEGNILIHKLHSGTEKDNDVPEVFRIDVETNDNELDLSYLQASEYKDAIHSMIQDYKPEKTREVGIQMKLILQDEVPVYQRPRRLSAGEKIDVEKQIEAWQKEGIIRTSTSDYASPIVLVKKKNGSTRICVDYRKLNKKIMKDRYPLPLIEDQLDLLQGAQIFSTLDLKNGFFHVPVEENSKKFTAFIVPNGHYEFQRVPFGLCNSPAVFQKFINAVFKDLITAGIVLTYMDDLIVPSVDIKHGLDNLRRVLGVASQFGLHINWSKCRFLQTKVEYLGHVVEHGRIQPSEHKTKAVMRFPTPRCTKDVQSFLGLTGYFRKFIYQYSIIARPLSDLLKKNVSFKFELQEQQAFEKLKLIMSSKPVLKLYRTNAETELHTDASSLGYGAILLQRDSKDSAFHPVYFASGKTTPAEEKYPSYELEVLAIVKSLKKFRVYLLGIPFKIVTDCKAFTMTLNKKDLCVRVARWALLLEEFRYTVEHRPGKSMIHVDALSRHPLPAVMILEESEEGIIARMQRAQLEDKDLREIRDNIERYAMQGYVVKNGILYKDVDDAPMIVLPKSMQVQVVRQAHGCGHFGVNKTEAIVKRDYWFGGMRSVVEKIIRNCVDCILAERKHGKQEGFLNAIDKGELPFDSYHVDHLGPLPSTKKTYRHIFAVIDAFSKFVWLYGTKSTDSAEVVNRLKKQSAIFGNPMRIISDRGSAFTANSFKDYCKEEGIQHVLVTTGIPRANGQIERINRTLIPLLTKLSSPKPEDWYKHLDVAMKYLNATPSRSTGTTPFRLLFGTRMKLREDPEVRELIEKEWVTMFEEERDELRRCAKRKIAEVQAQNRKNFNKKRKVASTYKEGDLVAIRRTQSGPGLKFYPKFIGPYRVSKILRSDRYVVHKVGDHEGTQVTSTAADHMKPWVHEKDEVLDDSEEENI